MRNQCIIDGGHGFIVCAQGKRYFHQRKIRSSVNIRKFSVSLLYEYTYHRKVQRRLRHVLLRHIELQATLTTSDTLRINHRNVLGTGPREQHVLLQRLHRVVVYLNENVCARIAARDNQSQSITTAPKTVSMSTRVAQDERHSINILCDVNQKKHLLDKQPI